MNGHSEKVSLIWPNQSEHSRRASLRPLWPNLVTVFAVMAMTSCTQYWAKPGGTAAEFEATKAACQAQSYVEFPPMPDQVMLLGGYTTPLQTTCTGSGYAVNCFTTGGQYIPPTYITVDRNEAARVSGFKSCLYAAGWQQVKNKEEAAEVTRSGTSEGGHTGTVPTAISEDANRGAVQYCDSIFKVRHDPAMIAVFNGSYDQCFQTRARELNSTR